MLNMDIFSSILQTILEVLITIGLPILLKFLVDWLRAKIAEAKSSMSQEQLLFAQALASSLVLAAEQNGLREALKNEGEAKKRWVMAQLESELSKRNINLNLETLSHLIESAVYDAFHSE